jgi:hypothetical protein
MTAFGAGFAFVRMVLGSLPDRMSGYRVAMWSAHRLAPRSCSPPDQQS